MISPPNLNSALTDSILFRSEEERLAALDELRILDTEPEQAYDDIVRLAAHICGTPISTVTFVAKNRQWFKARVGLEETESPIEQSFCKFALEEQGMLIVEDASKDARFANFPNVIAGPMIRFYAGAKLVTSRGFPVGTLCIIDKVSRVLTDGQQNALQALARQVMALLELRRRNAELAELAEAHSNALARIEFQMQEVKSEVQHRRWSDMLRRDSEMRFKSVIKTANDGIFLADDKFEIILWNDASQRIFRYSEKEAKRNRFEMLVSEGSRPQLVEYVDRLKSESTAKDVSNIIELVGLRKDKSEFPIELSISLWSNGDSTFYTGITRDITERKRVEGVKDEFVSTVSHELRTPLTSIRGALDLINGGMTGPLGDDTKRLTGIALHSTERLVRLINDILDSEKIASGKAEFNFRPVNLTEVVTAAVTEVKSFGDQYSVSLAIVDESPNIIINADADRIIQVMTNLISNAVKASSEGGEVRVKISKMDSAMRVEVIDKGAGIPLEFQPKIFGRFAMAHSGDKRRKTGSGLGLHIARSIVEKHSGTMGFQSVPGEGTVFYFDLPLTAEIESTQKMVTK